MTKCTCEHSGIEFEIKDGWISIKNKLPDKNTQVLCFNGGHMFGAYSLAEIKTDKDGITAWHVYGVHEYDAGFGCVTHWMNLPEPPK